MLTRPPEVHTDGHKPTSNGEYLRCTPLVQKRPSAESSHCSSCVRDEPRDRRQLAYQDVAFQDPSPLPSLREKPQVQSKRSVCGGGDLGRTRRLSSELGLKSNRSC